LGKKSKCLTEAWSDWGAGKPSRCPEFIHYGTKTGSHLTHAETLFDLLYQQSFEDEIVATQVTLYAIAIGKSDLNVTILDTIYNTEFFPFFEGMRYMVQDYFLGGLNQTHTI